MSSPANTFPPSPVKIMKAVPNSSSIRDEDDMSRRRPPDDSPFDDFTTREVMHNMMLATTAMCKAMEAQITHPRENGRRGWFQTGATIGAVLIAVFGISFIPTSTSNFREDLRMANYKIEQGEKRESELRDRIQSQEYIWNNLQKSLSALGIQVDGRTGEITAVRGRNVR